MEFGLSAEQMMLQESLNRYLSQHAGLARTRAFSANRESRATDVLEGLANLGISGLIIPEEFGGVGLSLLDAALVAECLGNHVTSAPFVGSQVAAPLLILKCGSPEQKTRWLTDVASGQSLVGVALSELTGARAGAGVTTDGRTLTGRALFPLDFEADAYLVVDDQKAIHWVDASAEGLERTLLSTIDVTRPTGELVFSQVKSEKLEWVADTRSALQAVVDAARVMLAADTLGAAQAMLDQAVVYARERQQFGRAIGSFQAVKHMCAEMAAALEPCRAMVWYAAHALEHLPDESSVVACLTKAHLAEVGTFVAKTATEVHGGMGFTDLVGLHYWFKRIGFNRQCLGNPNLVRHQAAVLQGLAAA